MRGCQACVHSLLWFRMYGHIGGTLPRVVVIMFPYTWTHHLVASMRLYFVLPRSVATHIPIHIETCAVATYVSIHCLAPESMDTYMAHCQSGHMVTCAVAAYMCILCRGSTYVSVLVLRPESVDTKLAHCQHSCYS